MNLFDKNRKDNALDLILANMMRGSVSYEQAIQDMTDDELWKHCFEDPSLPTDFCMQEWQRRDTACICPTEIRTGWIENDGKACCNICGKQQPEESIKIIDTWA